ncbi:flavin reductase family protein [Propionibacteriaceae bacterium Y2011]
MTIHSEHPFLEPPENRRPLRRIRSRWPAGVSVWTVAVGPRAARGEPVGLTVSSLVIADGEPGEVVGLLDPDSDLAEALSSGGRAMVNLLGVGHQELADVFAGLSPAPGGPFTVGDWQPDPYGPRLADALATLAIEVTTDPVAVGWSSLIRGTVVSTTIAEGESLAHLRGRYLEL